MTGSLLINEIRYELLLELPPSPLLLVRSFLLLVDLEFMVVEVREDVVDMVGDDGDCKASLESLAVDLTERRLD